jgi:hypothetical protein
MVVHMPHHFLLRGYLGPNGIKPRVVSVSEGVRAEMADLRRPGCP